MINRPAFASRPGKFCRGALLLLAAGILTGCGDEESPAPPPVEVNVVTVSGTDTPVPVEFPAQTEAVRTVEIRPQVSGIVKRQVFKEGELVRAGDLLFEIDPQPLQVALLQARATLAQAEAALVNAEQSYHRAKPLHEQDAISTQELEAAEASARGNAASVEAARAAVRQAELNLGYTEIRSPLDGFIGEANIKVGGLVTQNQTLMASVSTIDPIYVAVNISERGYLNWIGEPASASVGTGAGKLNLRYTMLLANGSEYPAPGRFNFIDRSVDIQTGTIRMRLEFPNKEQALRPGQFVRIRFPASVMHDAIVIPQRAVLSTQDQKYVFVVTPEGKAESRDVTMGMRLKVGWIVQQGLKHGDKVIVDGIQKVHPGSVVTATELPQEPAAQSPAAAGQAQAAGAPKAAQPGAAQPNAARRDAAQPNAARNEGAR